MWLANGRPSLLNNLFLDYPNVKFDMFHISYPYCGEAGALGRCSPMCIWICAGPTLFLLQQLPPR